jgi:carbon monoxide dehydrogenase subunit G
MNIEGTYTLQAPPEEVWSGLMDQQTIQLALPGLERLKQTDAHTFAFAMQVRQAPLRGTYSGKAAVVEQTFPSTYKLSIKGDGQATDFQSDFAINLTPHAQHTVVSYQGNIQLERGQVPASMVKATVKVLLEQFFTSLADSLRKAKEAKIYVPTIEELYEPPFAEEQLGEHFLLSSRTNRPTFWHRVVRLFGLGQQDPEQEEQWVKRLQQASFIASLLLLVWFGTTLPKRFSRRN